MKLRGKSHNIRLNVSTGSFLLPGYKNDHLCILIAYHIEEMKTVLFCLVSIISLAGVNGGESNDNKLVKNFYAETCPEAEDIIRKATEEHVAINPELPAKLLRMHFRDCFVRVIILTIYTVTLI